MHSCVLSSDVRPRSLFFTGFVSQVLITEWANQMLNNFEQMTYYSILQLYIILINITYNCRPIIQLHMCENSTGVSHVFRHVFRPRSLLHRKPGSVVSLGAALDACAKGEAWQLGYITYKPIFVIKEPVRLQSLIVRSYTDRFVLKTQSNDPQYLQEYCFCLLMIYFWIQFIIYITITIIFGSIIISIIILS